jgi:hypothetical protein
VKSLPSDPLAFQARVFDAFCSDLFDMAAGKSSSCERTNALRQVSIVRKAGEKQREEGLGSLSRSHASHEARSGLRPSGFDRGCNEEHRGGGTANNLPPSNS